VFNLLNATVACGTLGLPLAISQQGWALGIAMLLFMCVINAVSTRFLVSDGGAYCA
jgi:amino acid permease